MNSGRIMNLLVTIPAESRRMNVGKDVIRVLGSPAYICVLQRKDRKAIAITPCAAEHPMSFKVPDRLLTDGQWRMMINGIQFIQVLLEANGLAAGKDHQFKGRYDAEKNAVIISLEKDEQSALSPSQKNRSKYFFPQIPTFDIDAKLFLRDQQSLVASALTFVVFSIRRLPLLELSFESHLKFRHA